MSAINSMVRPVADGLLGAADCSGSAGVTSKSSLTSLGGKVGEVWGATPPARPAVVVWAVVLGRGGTVDSVGGSCYVAHPAVLALSSDNGANLEAGRKYYLFSKVPIGVLDFSSLGLKRTANQYISIP